MPYLTTLPDDAAMLDVLRLSPKAAAPLVQFHEELMRGSSPLTEGQRDFSRRGWCSCRRVGRPGASRRRDDLRFVQLYEPCGPRIGIACRREILTPSGGQAFERRLRSPPAASRRRLIFVGSRTTFRSQLDRHSEHILDFVANRDSDQWRRYVAPGHIQR